MRFEILIDLTAKYYGVRESPPAWDTMIRYRRRYIILQNRGRFTFQKKKAFACELSSIIQHSVPLDRIHDMSRRMLQFKILFEPSMIEAKDDDEHLML